MYIQNKFTSFWYVRIYFPKKSEERILGTRQLKNTKSHWDFPLTQA